MTRKIRGAKLETKNETKKDEKETKSQSTVSNSKPESKSQPKTEAKSTKAVSKGDFIEIHYTGMLKEDKSIFDSTRVNQDGKTTVKPMVICVGEGFILPALEEGLVGKKPGKYAFELSAENAFGKKDAKLLKLVPRKLFKQQDIEPYVGLEVNIDNQFGIIRSSSGGRVIVDFNHPLSGRDVVYQIEINKFVNDDKEKVDAILSISGIHYNSVAVKDGKAMIVLEHEVPDEYKKLVEDKIKEKTSVKNFDYVIKASKDHKH